MFEGKMSQHIYDLVHEITQNYYITITKTKQKRTCSYFMQYLLTAWITLNSSTPDNEVHGVNMGPTWVLSAPAGPHVGPLNLAIRDALGQLYNFPSAIEVNLKHMGKWKPHKSANNRDITMTKDSTTNCINFVIFYDTYCTQSCKK